MKPVPPGDASSYDGACPAAAAAPAAERDTENISTTNLTVADKWGNVVDYTLTIEQTGGSGIVVPGRGFLLNNELTDFSTVYDPADPNRIEPGKRPRSSMSPTIILKEGKPFLALGSPGGSTIITTVLQTILNRVDLGMTISEAIAAPRASQRNTAKVTAEPEFITTYGSQLAPYGHQLTPSGDAFTSAAEIGAATAIEFRPDGAHGRRRRAGKTRGRLGDGAQTVAVSLATPCPTRRITSSRRLLVGDPTDYVFLTVWRVAGTGEVTAVLGDADSLPGGGRRCIWVSGSGGRCRSRTEPARPARLHTKGWLPYTLRWTLTITEPMTEKGFALTAAGDLNGPGG